MYQIIIEEITQYLFIGSILFFLSNTIVEDLISKRIIVELIIIEDGRPYDCAICKIILCECWDLYKPLFNTYKAPNVAPPQPSSGLCLIKERAFCHISSL